MSDLITAVNNLIKGKMVEESLGTYVSGLSCLYKRLAELRMAMNYFTFAEIYNELDEDTRIIIEPSVNTIQRIINQIIINDTIDSKAIEEIHAFRDGLISKMEILTAYTDRFQIYEYILNRVEFRFNHSDFDDNYYYGRFEKDILNYVISDKDNSVVNMKISQITGQVPMRLSKDKFYDMLRNSFSIYKGNDKRSIDDFSYMIRTAGMIYVPKDFDMEFDLLHTYFSQLEDIDAANMTEDEYTRFRRILDDASELVEKYSDFFVMITEVLNDVYSIALNFEALTDINEWNKLKEIIKASYDIIEGYEADTSKISEEFVAFEGMQERLNSRIFNPESALDEIKSINGDFIKESIYNEKLDNLIITSKLSSASTFASLNEEGCSDISEEYADKAANAIIEEFAGLFENIDRYKRRAVMALVISELPVFFNNIDEFGQYVHVALSQCSDYAERQACMEIINMMITSD